MRARDRKLLAKFILRPQNYLINFVYPLSLALLSSSWKSIKSIVDRVEAFSTILLCFFYYEIDHRFTMFIRCLFKFPINGVLNHLCIMFKNEDITFLSLCDVTQSQIVLNFVDKFKGGSRHKTRDITTRDPFSL